MRPDRFGKSRNHEFTESPGREREHPFESAALVRSIVASVTLTGFFGFRDTSGSTIGERGYEENGVPVTWGNPGAYTHNLSREAKIYRRASIADSNAIIGDRTVEWEFEKVVFGGGGGPIRASETVTGSVYVYDIPFPEPGHDKDIAHVAGGALAQYQQTETTRNIRTVPAQDPDAERRFGISSTTTVSKPIEFAPWEALLRHHLNLASEFPAAYNLFLKAGKEEPDEVPNDFGDYELVTPGQGAADHASLAVSQLYGFTPYPSAYAGTTTPPLVHIVSGSMRITMVKVLFGTRPTDLPPFLTRVEWLVGNNGGGVYEISCSRSQPVDEILHPPTVEEIGSDRIRMEFSFPIGSGNLFKSDAIIFRKFAFPGSAIPGPAVVGNLVPTCAPTFV